MKRLLFAVAACGLATAAQAEPQDFVFLAEARPVLVRVHVLADGKPSRANWDTFMLSLFKAHDANSDGALDKTEAERLPSAPQIFSAGLGSVIGGLGSGGATSATMDALDTDKNGKVTPAEMTAYYRKNGLAPFQFQLGPPPANPVMMGMGNRGGEPSVQAVSDATFTQFDTDKDGKLSRAELAAASTVLLKMDENDDEIVTARELVPGTRSGGGNAFAMMMGGGGQAKSNDNDNKTLQPIATAGEAPVNMVKFMLERYGPKSDKPEQKKLKREDLGLDDALFAKLDTNKDGALDAAELAKFVNRPPDVELTVQMSRESEGDVTPAKGLPLTAKVTTRRGVALLDLGATRLEIRGTQPSQADPFGQYIESQLSGVVKQADTNNDGVIDAAEAEKSRQFRGLFKLMDRDGDGKVTEKEMTAYFENAREQQVKAEAACVSLVLTDTSRGLFDLLDGDRDGRLSVREMRSASQLLTQFGRGKDHLTKADIPRSYQARIKPGPAQNGPLNNIAAITELYRGGGGYESGYVSSAGPTWLRKMDRNGDGDVSRKEFLFSETLFRQLDLDGDGLISTEEAAKAPAKQ